MSCENFASKIRVLDGGFGTQISRRLGLPIDGDALWSARFLSTNPQAIIETHLDFLNAGSNVISTNTYQASIEGFQKYLNLTAEESYQLIKEAVQLARKARDTFTSNISATKCCILIAGSVGPFAASLHDGSEYNGSYAANITAEYLKQWHRPRIAALLEAGVDLLALETLPCGAEAEALLDLMKEYPSAKVWISFNCKDGKSIASGENFQETVRKCYNLNPEQIVAVGANCTSPMHIEELFTDINTGREISVLPLITYPNSGECYTKDEGWCDRNKCEPIYKYVSRWLDLGISWIGGCCRMYSDDIVRIRVEVDKWQERQNAIES